MSKPFTSAGALIAESWKFFITNWQQTTRVSIWFLYLGLVEFALYVAQKFAPVGAWLLVPVELATVVIAVWTGLRLMLLTLKLADGKKPDLQADAAQAWTLFLPLIWVGLLQALIILGGLLLLVVPGIYLSVALCMSQLIMVDRGLRGLKALAASRELVRDRWWATLWRSLSGSLVFGLGLVLAFAVLFGIFGLAMGFDRLVILLGAETPDPLFEGTLTLLNAVLQAAVLPLFIGFQIKLYRALEKSK